MLEENNRKILEDKDGDKEKSIFGGEILNKNYIIWNKKDILDNSLINCEDYFFKY